MHAGCAEDQIRIQIIQIPLPQTQDAAHPLQLHHFLIQIFSGGAVAAGYMAAKFQKHPHQRAVADAQTKHRDFPSPQGFKILFKCSRHGSFLTS